MNNHYKKALRTFSVCLLLFSLLTQTVAAASGNYDETKVFSVEESKTPKKITIKSQDDDFIILTSTNIERIRQYFRAVQKLKPKEIPVLIEPLNDDELVLKQIVDFFISKGLTATQVSGIIGNLRMESGLNPAIIQGGEIASGDYVPVRGVGFGLAQWTDGRQKGLIKLARSSNRNARDLSLQLDYIWFELAGGYQETLEELKTTDNPVDAAIVFHDGYERSADAHKRVVAARGGSAKEIYQWQQEHASYLAAEN